ncbi:MAG TPA: hypothetical protein DIT64_06265 [Verrucomicrobiales bacterium]|nr:hypothetical protein [Verrucomicrobiales bacterium]HCN77688.1 hypothetical protein [Verrucomicrobiales bacterium]
MDYAFDGKKSSESHAKAANRNGHLVRPCATMSCEHRREKPRQSAVNACQFKVGASLKLHGML